MSKEDKEIIQRIGTAASVLPKAQKRYLLGRAEALADAVRERGEAKDVSMEKDQKTGA